MRSPRIPSGSSILKLGLLAGLSSACATAPLETESLEIMGATVKPPPHPELELLQPMVGSWKGQSKLVHPASSDGGEPVVLEGGGRAEWALGGMVLKREGWRQVGEGQISNYVEYIAWDPKAGKFHTWFHDDWGQSGEGWLSLDPDGRTFRYRAKQSRFDGGVSEGEGTAVFVSDDVVEWTWTADGGAQRLEGTDRRSR